MMDKETHGQCARAPSEDETFPMHLHQFIDQTQALCPMRYATSSGDKPKTFAHE